MVLLLLVWVDGCAQVELEPKKKDSSSSDSDSDGDSDTDSDSDLDSDTDLDSDSDGDGDSDGDTDTGPDTGSDTGVLCDDPPDDECLTWNVLMVYEELGSWNGSECEYDYEAVVCEEACLDGECVDDPCLGVTCDSPPPDECVGDTLQVFVSPGTCTEGVCSYDSIDTPCEFSCFEGECQGCQQGDNVAASATASSSGGGSGSVGPAQLNNGELEDTCEYCWVAASSTPADAWIQLSWSSSQTLWGLWIDTTHFDDYTCPYADGRALAGGTVQWWNGYSWVDAGVVSDQSDDWGFEFATEISTSMLRVYGVHATTLGVVTENPVIYEWEVYSCD